MHGIVGLQLSTLGFQVLFSPFKPRCSFSMLGVLRGRGLGQGPVTHPLLLPVTLQQVAFSSLLPAAGSGGTSLGPWKLQPSGSCSSATAKADICSPLSLTPLLLNSGLYKHQSKSSHAQTVNRNYSVHFCISLHRNHLSYYLPLFPPRTLSDYGIFRFMRCVRVTFRW